MSLDVETPDPPTLHGPGDPGEYDAVDDPDEWTGATAPREALADFLEAGAWEDAFDEWCQETYLTEAEFRLVVDAGLIDEFDFFWNEAAEDVGYRAPSVPDDLGDWTDEGIEGEAIDVRGIDGELDDLGRTVSEVLENEYISRTGEEFGFFADR